MRSTKPDVSAASHPQSRWKTLLVKLRLRKLSELEPSTIKLTQRNLEEFFNPDYSEEHDAFHAVQGPRKVSIPEWIQLLP